MQLVERYIIQRNYPHHQEIDFLCLLAKNLSKYTHFYMLPNFIFQQKDFNSCFINKPLEKFLNHQVLHTVAVQKALLNLHSRWLKSLAVIQKYPKNKTIKNHNNNKNHKSYKHYKNFIRIKLSKNPHQETSRYLLVYTAGAMSKLKIKAALTTCLHKNIFGIHQAIDNSWLNPTIAIPKIDHYMVKVVYEKKELEHDIKQNLNSMTATYLATDKSATANNDQLGFIPDMVNGRMLPSNNTYSHQQKAQLKSLLPTYQTISKKLNTIKNKLYRAGDSLLIHADVNGSLNILILTKIVPIALSLGV